MIVILTNMEQFAQTIYLSIENPELNDPKNKIICQGLDSRMFVPLDWIHTSLVQLSLNSNILDK